MDIDTYPMSAGNPHFFPPPQSGFPGVSASSTFSSSQQNSFSSQPPHPSSQNVYSLPPTPSPSRKRRAPSPPPHAEPLAKRLEHLSIRPPPSRRSPTPTSSGMDLDPSNVVYVNSLSDSDSEPEEVDANGKKKLIFIPDIERELTRIPEHVLRSGSEEQCKALVLYRQPGVEDKGRDLRRQILEARRRKELEKLESVDRAGEPIQLGWKDGFDPSVNGFGQMEGFEPTQMEQGFNPNVNAWGTGEENVDMDMEID